METKRILAIWAALGVLLVLGDEAFAQRGQRPQRFQPSRPTVSPYLNLFRNNNSPVPNYYTFVRPELNQMQVNQQQQQLLLRQSAEIQGLQQNLLQAQTAGPVSGTSSWFQTPGSRSTFMNTGGYFGRAGAR